MKFRNPHTATVTHTIRRRTFEVPPGAEVEIPDDMVDFIPLGSYLRPVQSAASDAGPATAQAPTEPIHQPKSDAPTTSGLTEEQKRQLAARGAK